jgi:Delta3-Delta2-enoyl-CoA isomerase
VAVTLTRHDDDVFVLNLGDGDNRFHPDWLVAVDAALTELEAEPEPKSLVTTAEGKIWSNGLDLEWVRNNPDRRVEYAAASQRLMARFLTLPLITVAAIQGHAFAAGAMIALAHDFRIMRADRGFFCLPEVDIHIPFTPGMAALIQARLTPKTAHRAMTTGHRYGGEAALRDGIVDRVSDADELMSVAISQAAELTGKASPTLGKIKSQMYGPAVAALRSGREV